VATTIPKEELRALIASLADTPVSNVIWDGEPVPFVAAKNGKVQGLIVLDPTARRRVGVDEEKREYPTPTTLKRTFSGQRVVTLSVLAQNYGAEEGFDLLESVRTLISSDENRAALNGMSLALAATSDVRTLDGSAGNRALSFAHFDIELNQRVEKVITTTGDTYIQSVTVAGDDELDLAGTDVIAAP
jgi:hypothetical protein